MLTLSHACPVRQLPTLACGCDTCRRWRQVSLSLWRQAQEDNPGAVIFLQPKGSTAAFALLEDARLINSLCGHMVRHDTFGVADVFVCDLSGVRAVLRRHGRKAVLVSVSE